MSSFCPSVHKYLQLLLRIYTYDFNEVWPQPSSTVIALKKGSEGVYRESLWQGGGAVVGLMVRLVSLLNHSSILRWSGDLSSILPNSPEYCFGSTNALHRVWSKWMDCGGGGVAPFFSKTTNTVLMKLDHNLHHPLYSWGKCQGCRKGPFLWYVLCGKLWKRRGIPWLVGNARRYKIRHIQKISFACCATLVSLGGTK